MLPEALGVVRFLEMFRQPALLLASSCTLVLACGGRSMLDDYADGIPAIVPQAGPGFGSPQGDGDVDGGTAGNADGGGQAQGSPVGGACDKDPDCADKGAICLKEITILSLFPITFPGGSCTIPGCESDDDCPEGSGCLEGFQEPACTALCEGAQDCRPEYSCDAIPTSDDPRTYCQPPIDVPNFPGFGG
jgi:hypothetical protein